MQRETGGFSTSLSCQVPVRPQRLRELPSTATDKIYRVIRSVIIFITVCLSSVVPPRTSVPQGQDHICLIHCRIPMQAQSLVHNRHSPPIC